MSCLKYLFILLLAIIYLPSHSYGQTTSYTLKEAVEYALKVNPSVEAKLLAIDRAQMEVGVAQSYFWPTASLMWSRSKLSNTGNTGSSEDYSNKYKSRGLRVSLSLFSGFAHLNTLQKSLLSVDMEEARHNQARLELISNIQLQFLSLLKAREDMKTVKDSKKRIATQLKAAEAFVKVGMAPYLNVLQNEVELTKVNQQEIRVMNTIRNAEVMLNRYLGYDTSTKINYTGNLKDFSGVIGHTEKEAIDVSLQNRPDIIIAQKSIAIATKQSHITAGRYLPNINVSYDNMRADKVYDDGIKTPDYSRSYWNIGLNISWDIFTGGSTTFGYLGDRKNMASLKKEYEDTISAARAYVIKSLLDIKAAKDLIAVSRKGVEAASESYAMANKRYSTGTGTITELLDAQLRLTQAEEDYSLSLAEFHSARSRFFYNIGKENIGLD